MLPETWVSNNLATCEVVTVLGVRDTELTETELRAALRYLFAKSKDTAKQHQRSLELMSLL